MCNIINITMNNIVQTVITIRIDEYVGFNKIVVLMYELLLSFIIFFF